MSERSAIGVRAFTPHIDTSNAIQGASVDSIPAGSTFSLRIAPELARAVKGAAGFNLTGNINTALKTNAKVAARLGPDEWLFIAPDSQSEALTGAIGAALAGHFHSLVDVSDRNVAITVAGQGAPIALNAGIALDLDDAAFPAGSATRTILGKAEVILMRPGPERVYRVDCWRSFAPYVRKFLEEAARSVKI